MTWDEQAIQEIKDVDERKSTKQRAAVKLGVNIKTIERKLRSYRQHGMSCFTHKNTGKAPANKIDFDTITAFIENHDLAGCNFAELKRLLRDYEKIHVSSSYLRKLLREMRDRAETISQQKQEVLSALEQEEVTGVWRHPTKPRSKYFGERLEMDASSYIWIKGLGSCTLHVCIDDASGFLLGLWLEHEETLNGYYKLMEQVLTTHGIPLNLRTDKRTVFIYAKKGGGLPFRFSMEGITTIEQANEYLQSTYMALLDDQGKRAALPYHTKVTVARLLDGSLYAAHAKRCYALEPVPQTLPWSFTKQMEFKKHDALMKKLAPCCKSPHESRIA